MAAKFYSLKDEEIVRVMRAKVIMSGTAAFTELAIDTQLSIERGVIWLIKAIEFFIDSPDLSEVGANSEEKAQLQLTRESKTVIIDPSDPDSIQRYEFSAYRCAAIGTDAGPLWHLVEMPKVFGFEPGLPYAAQTIYFGIDSTLGSATTAFARLFYTIRSVSDKYFFRVAQALLG